MCFNQQCRAAAGDADPNPRDIWHMAQSSCPDGPAKAMRGALQDTRIKGDLESLKFHGNTGGTGGLFRGEAE